MDVVLIEDPGLFPLAGPYYILRPRHLPQNKKQVHDIGLSFWGVDSTYIGTCRNKNKSKLAVSNALLYFCADFHEEMIQFEKRIKDGLKPPTRKVFLFQIKWVFNHMGPLNGKIHGNLRYPPQSYPPNK